MMPREGQMKRQLLIISSIFSLTAFGHGNFNPKNFQVKSTDKDMIITIGEDAVLSTMREVGIDYVEVIDRRDGIALVKTKETAMPYLSHIMHDQFRRCGGFVRHESEKDASDILYATSERLLGSKAIFADYSINQQDIIRPFIDQVNAGNMANVIKKLSSYKNRYYKSKSGVESSNWIFDKWKELSKGRSDVEVEKYQHSRWPQPSIILTLKGSSDETIVVGGHADSVAGWWNRERAKAPGADDNASGIATITEIIRVLLENSYQPQKTIKFMAYAAEEVGLLGSKAIAQEFKTNRVNVIGVMQLDMTNYKGSSDQDIVMMTDFTNEDQNQFIGRLIDEYLPGLSWGYDRCGYACSDHASWTNAGFPASMPFEAKKADMNGRIHTANDTISRSNGNANHAAKFAKMGISFVVELDN